MCSGKACDPRRHWSVSPSSQRVIIKLSLLLDLDLKWPHRPLWVFDTLASFHQHRHLQPDAHAALRSDVGPLLICTFSTRAHPAQCTVSISPSSFNLTPLNIVMVTVILHNAAAAEKSLVFPSLWRWAPTIPTLGASSWGLSMLRKPYNCRGNGKGITHKELHTRWQCSFCFQRKSAVIFIIVNICHTQHSFIVRVIQRLSDCVA